MKFDNLKNLTEIWDCFIADAKNVNFEDTEQAIDDFQNYLVSLDVNLKAKTVQDIYEHALLLASTLEQQGFYHGLSYGINLSHDARELSERK